MIRYLKRKLGERKPLLAAFLFMAAFGLVGTPSAPIANVVPTIHAEAHAYAPCDRAIWNMAEASYHVEYWEFQMTYGNDYSDWIRGQYQMALAWLQEAYNDFIDHCGA